ncbi:MAG TPA: polysaccharide deacetylase family protein [Chloroflexota bacterium]
MAGEAGLRVSRRRLLKLAGGASAWVAMAPRALAAAPVPFVSEFRMYHEVSYAAFKSELLGLLDAGAQPLSIETIVGALNGEVAIPPGLRTFHITWDDARLSQYTDGWPAIRDVQRERGVFVPVTGFLITKFDHLPLAVQDVPPDTPCYHEDGNLPTNHRFMTKAQAIELIQHGIHAANHTVNHADLPALASGAMQGEIALAEQHIQALWDQAGVLRPVKVFAYPYGRFNADIIAVLQGLGYDAAFSTIGSTRHSAAKRWTLGRVGFGG